LIDSHSHFIPSIDDGARNPEDALELVRMTAEGTSLGDGRKVVSFLSVFADCIGKSQKASPPGIGIRIEGLRSQVEVHERLTNTSHLPQPSSLAVGVQRQIDQLQRPLESSRSTVRLVLRASVQEPFDFTANLPHLLDERELLPPPTS